MRRSQTLTGIAALAVFLAGAATAQTSDEPFGDELTPDMAYVEDGFVEIPFTDGRGTDERETIDRKIAAPLAESLGARDYGFSFALTDLDGDGADDVAVTLRVAVQVPFGEGSGAPTYVYLYDDGDFRLVAFERAMILASKVVEGPAADIAFVNEDGYVRFSPTPDGPYERTVLRGR